MRALLPVLALLAACGGNSADNGPKQVAQAYIAALSENDEAKACKLQTASSREGDGCTLHSGPQIVPKAPKFEDAVESGNRARVLVTGSNGSVTLELVQEGEDWKIEEYQGQLPQP